MGHIDFPKRYYGEIYYTEAVMNEIVSTLVEKDMILEINTSSLRKGHAQTMPGKELLEIYQANGGKYVTIGSDAHVVADIGADYMVTKRLIEDIGLQEVVYRKRKRIILANPFRHKTLEERTAEFGGKLELDGEYDWGGSARD